MRPQRVRRRASRSGSSPSRSPSGRRRTGRRARAGPASTGSPGWAISRSTSDAECVVISSEGPRRPPRQTVDGVARAPRSVERQPVLGRPRRCTSPSASRFGHGASSWPRPDDALSVLREAEDERTPVVLQHPQARPALRHHGAVAAPADLELVSARRHHGAHPARRASKSGCGADTCALPSPGGDPPAEHRRHPGLGRAPRRDRGRRQDRGALRRGRPRRGDGQPGCRGGQGLPRRVRRTGARRLRERDAARRGGRCLQGARAGRRAPGPPRRGHRHHAGQRDGRARSRRRSRAHESTCRCS